MALLPQDRQSQVMMLITLGMLGLGYAFWNYWAKPTGEEIAATQAEIKSMEDVIAQAKADIASLPRIIVPQDVILKAAAQQAQKLLGDTLGALLEAQFGIRTFVKAAALAAAAARKGAGGAR